MAGWTKEQYDDAYLCRVDRYFNAEHPEVPQDPAQTGQVILHYHRYFMGPILSDMWARLAPILNIASTQNVLIVGAGFGWGVEAFIAETLCTTVGIDLSDYINAEKNNTEEAEIDAAIVAAGLDPAAGRGAAIKAYVYDAQPRTNVIVLQEDAQTNTSRNAIRAALGGNWPDVCIVEDLIDETITDQEITQINNALNLFAGQQRVIWIARETATRTLQQLQTLTGSEVISPDGQTHLIP